MDSLNKDRQPLNLIQNPTNRGPNEELLSCPKLKGKACADKYLTSIEAAQRCLDEKDAKQAALRCTLREYGADEPTIESFLARNEKELDQKRSSHLLIAQQALEELTRGHANSTVGRRHKTVRMRLERGRRRAKSDAACEKLVRSKRKGQMRLSSLSNEVKFDDANIPRHCEVNKNKVVEGLNSGEDSRYPCPGDRYLVVDEQGRVSAAIVLSAQRTNPVSDHLKLPESLGFDHDTGVVRWVSGYGDGEEFEARRHYLTLMSSVPDYWAYSWVSLKDLKDWDASLLSSEMVTEVDNHVHNVVQEEIGRRVGKHKHQDNGNDGEVAAQDEKGIIREDTGEEDNRCIDRLRGKTNEEEDIRNSRRAPAMEETFALNAGRRNGDPHKEKIQNPTESDEITGAQAELDYQRNWNSTKDNDTKSVNGLVSFTKTSRPKRLIATIKLPSTARQRFKAMMNTPRRQNTEPHSRSRLSTPVSVHPSSSRRGGRYMPPRSYREETLEPRLRLVDLKDKDYIP